MSGYIVPCEDPANDPEDWFIEKDGRQYPDDELLTQFEYDVIVDNVSGRINPEATVEEYEQACDEAIEGAEAAALEDALRRRRHAKDKCHVECHFRLKCLTIALSKPGPSHGTWGGYYPEELKQIRTLRDKKAKAAESHDADVASEE